MFEVFIEGYVRFFGVFLPALTVGIVAVNARLARLAPAQIVRAIGVTAVVLGLWFAAAAAMGERGLLMPPATISDPPYVMIFLLGGTALLWGLARKTALGRAISDQASQAFLIGFQIPRVMGGVFLIGWATGQIPWQFAIPAGIGDIWAGIAGYRALRAVNRGDADADARVMRANLIGLADFAVAVLTGLTTSEGFAHLLAYDTPNIINAYPLALFPAFFVPIFISFHLLSIGRLRQAKAASAPA